MKHTKGKWELNSCGDIVVKDLSESPCVVGQTRIAHVIKHAPCWVEEDEANAHLIVAAPQLLAACERIKKLCWVDIGQPKAPTKNDYRIAVLDIRRTAESAIEVVKF